MPTSEVSISNIALSWLGGGLITSFEDDSTESKLCAANYDFSRDAVLEDRNWTFAMARAMPNLLAEPPVFGYSSAFQLPPDFIRVVRIGQLASLEDEIADWVKEGDQILVNAGVLYMRYIKRITDPTKFSPGFVQALAARIAADICVSLTNNVEMFAGQWQLYLNKLEEAGAIDGLQGKNDVLHSRKLTGVR